MINYAIYTELSKLLLKISLLTGKLYLTGGSFYAAVLDYLKELQTFAETHKLYIGSDISLETDKLYLYNGSGKRAEEKICGRKRMLSPLFALKMPTGSLKNF